MTALSKEYVIPGMTIGFLVLITMAAIWAGTKYNQVEDVRDRQAKYIERRNVQHDAMSDDIKTLEAELEELKLRLAARFGEVP